MQQALRVQLLPSSTGGDDRRFYATSFLVNGTIAIDAGCVGSWSGTERQAGIRHLLLTHSHQDHIATLPMLLENTFELGDAIEVHGNAAVLACLRRDVFNDRVWPDLLSDPPPTPYAVLRELEAERTLELEGLAITPVPVDHAVPTFGFVVEAAGARVAFSGDTGPTERLWQVGRERGGLDAVFLECAFPDAMSELAAVSRHHTPATFGRELAKLDVKTRVIAFHIKPGHHDAIVGELHGLEDPRIEIGVPGREYAW